MSGVRAAQAIPEQSPEADGALDAMQDVLYEILAEGIDPDLSETPTGAIEAFLHQHARSPKSLGEFREFFHQHGISARGRRQPPPAPVSELSLPPLAQPLPASAAQAPSGHRLVAQALPAAEGLMQLSPEPAGRRGAVPWAVVAALIAAFTGALWYGFTTLGELRADLQAAEVRTQAQRAELQLLEDRSAGIQSSVAANGELIHRMDQKSDLMLESLLEPPPPPKKRWQRKK